ncbi:protein serine/threonine phosphatase 2C [Pilatotrama ljubarskyi]|nr:protein serine/threonine phosphatase 2C [Pilatotrama ljubarskyi]
MASSMDEMSPPSSGLIRETSVPEHLAFTCAVAAAQGTRPSMEDTHTIVVPFAGIHGQGLFAVFDGHGGKEASEWCKENYAKCLLSALQENESAKVTDALNKSFREVDQNLEQMWTQSGGEVHSGSTAVVAFIRIEDERGQQSFAPSNYEPLATAVPGEDADGKYPGGTGSVKTRSRSDKVFVPPAEVRRVLYTANVGDARGVLCQDGKAVRLTYDDKASDKKEARRIEKAGGLILEGRVDGVLIPTRALGDAPLNQYVTSSPHTVEMELDEKDEFLILACDGLWDVVNDQEAVDLIRGVQDAKEAAELLVNEALGRHTQDNVTVLVVRLRDTAGRS